MALLSKTGNGADDARCTKSASEECSLDLGYLVACNMAFSILKLRVLIVSTKL